MSDCKKLIKYPELAQKLGIAEITARKWKADGKLPFIALGRSIFFDDEQIDRWIDSQRGGVSV